MPVYYSNENIDSSIGLVPSGSSLYWAKSDEIYIVIWCYYRKTSSISRTKFQNLNVSCIILQLSSLNPLKPGVKLRMKM